jgi:hypothetical protein
VKGRVCIRAGCGKLLLDGAGNPDFNDSRKFCDVKCRTEDKRERMQMRREKIIAAGRCPLCGQSCGSGAAGPREGD